MSYADQVILFETNIDDMSGEFFGGLIGRLFDAGALDAWLTPIFGKKNRPCYQLSVLLKAENERSVVKVIFRDTTTAGLRRQVVDRVVMNREMLSVVVFDNIVGIKKLVWEDVVKFTPEWDDCVKVADALGRPVNEIYVAAQAKAYGI